jgi:aminopeptidase-like protein
VGLYDSRYEELGREMHELARELFPIARSVAGPGYRRSLDTLERVAGPLERHRFVTGEQVFDWTIPNEWTIRDAWIRGPGGETVVSLADSNLHVVSHSVPVRAEMALEELEPHLHSLPGQPDAIPYRTAYSAEDWGFCLPDRLRRSLAPGRYEVCIDADLGPGHVERGELTIEGRSSAEVLL